MGFHVCEYCLPPTRPATSSGDVTLCFMVDGKEHKWIMPDMIIHYVRDHGYLPDAEFIEDAMHGHSCQGTRRQTRGMTTMSLVRTVGYLSGDYPQGEVLDGFVEKLQRLMEQAGYTEERVQKGGATR
jgi:hypothetical protein